MALQKNKDMDKDEKEGKDEGRDEDEDGEHEEPFDNVEEPFDVPLSHAVTDVEGLTRVFQRLDLVRYANTEGNKSNAPRTFIQTQPCCSSFLHLISCAPYSPYHSCVR